MNEITGKVTADHLRRDEAIGRLSVHLDLHSENTWPTALILMALCEVLSRAALLLYRYRRAPAPHRRCRSSSRWADPSKCAVTTDSGP